MLCTILKQKKIYVCNGMTLRVCVISKRHEGRSVNLDRNAVTYIYVPFYTVHYRRTSESSSAPLWKPRI